ncbi:acyl-CoA dehydrogenase family protein [Truepera radiovictrix]|uniref:Acyl-CoA dehydrogenase domain protein n=1 Tax=Truepera radiovictrix (strain DSM 17093 / CIP 108686 / LMG 22925 / RQ-24) TaxID=649638 RepID=D7CU84_TRURR|nr:acyl-CoA dehydrogenase family protein [Truepera radiovictrix]ADI13982.1 acyl-CoA dehydrogenase domain protein [Truepera radiovictrix DSM 17093]WMT57457.1 acyl-CoA dehydrogenase family protein [Truepera radiovictrix]
MALAGALARGFAARAAEADQQGELPEADVADLKGSGYLALSVPARYGGAGASLGVCTEAQLALAEGSTSTALVAAMQLHLFGHALETGAWGELAPEFCERAVRGELFNAAASEPQLGSPSRGGLPQTEAVREGDALVVTGHKTWVTGGERLEHLLVRVTLDEQARTLWLPNHLPGVRWKRTWGGGLSLRASNSDDVFFDRVRVPVSHLVAEGRAGPNLWFPTLIAATYLGTAFAAQEAAARYALERVPTALGRPIATLPTIQRQLGEMAVRLAAARTLLVATAHAWTGEGDREAFYPRVVAAKHVAIEAALWVTEAALRLAGGASLGPELPLERLFRDVRAGLMHPPSGDAALELVGRRALGL